MKFIHIYEILRQKLLRRITDGDVRVSDLSRLTGLTQSHVSNFLRNKRQFSQEALDRVLEACKIQVEDLLPPPERPGRATVQRWDSVPIVSHKSALFEPAIRPSAVLAFLPLLPGALDALLSSPATERKHWDRFVAVRVTTEDALAMDPIVFPGAIIVIDRHSNALHRHAPMRPNLYAIRHGAHLVVRYADFASGRLVLRPHNDRFPVDLLEIDPGTRPQHLIVGRVILVQNSM